ncbi:MAG TPA: hypothetical protein VOA87_17935, partial [Thermoanaerobaculia bacterium]|nr:hypothetical protein [Thermoanaerobaculia bacterium]
MKKNRCVARTLLLGSIFWLSGTFAGSRAFADPAGSPAAAWWSDPRAAGADVAKNPKLADHLARLA